MKLLRSAVTLQAILLCIVINCHHLALLIRLIHCNNNLYVQDLLVLNLGVLC